MSNTVCLAMTWNPRGELERLLRLLPQMAAAYAAIVVTLPPTVDPALVEELERHAIRVGVCQEWSHGRWLALDLAHRASTAAVHYADCDRLLHWVETEPQEWRQTLEQAAVCDFLLIGRSAWAYQTHPRALVETEALSNRVISHLIGQTVDVSAGSKGFSREAVRWILEHCPPGHALGTDGEWTVGLVRAGFRMSYLEVKGLDWESADRYRQQAVRGAEQQSAAAAYDADPQHWSQRTAVAKEVIEWALQAEKRQDDWA